MTVLKAMKILLGQSRSEDSTKEPKNQKLLFLLSARMCANVALSWPLAFDLTGKAIVDRQYKPRVNSISHITSLVSLLPLIITKCHKKFLFFHAYSYALSDLLWSYKDIKLFYVSSNATC